MNDRIVNPFIAIVLGTGTGMLLTVSGQKLLNQHYQNTCHQRSNHQLVMITSFIGDSYYCIDKRYL